MSRFHSTLERVCHHRCTTQRSCGEKAPQPEQLLNFPGRHLVDHEEIKTRIRIQQAEVRWSSLCLWCSSVYDACQRVCLPDSRCLAFSGWTACSSGCLWAALSRGGLGFSPTCMIWLFSRFSCSLLKRHLSMLWWKCNLVPPLRKPALRFPRKL